MILVPIFVAKSGKKSIILELNCNFSASVREISVPSIQISDQKKTKKETENVGFLLPTALCEILSTDRKMVVENGKVLKLPCRITVTKIIEDVRVKFGDQQVDFYIKFDSI